MKQLLPILIASGAALAGAGAGAFLRLNGAAAVAPPAGEMQEAPPQEVMASEKASIEKKKAGKHGGKSDHGKGEPAPTFLKFGRQFVMPVVVDGELRAMMILDVIVELEASVDESVYAKEPRLRDAVMRALLQRSSTGELANVFMDAAVLEAVRGDIHREVAAIIGDGVKSVLIMDVGYQAY